MGHRALVAYERPDGRYDRHYAHWGATDLVLRRGIGPETPFAGERGRWRPRVDPAPRATGLSFDDAVAFDRREFEAFYFVTFAWVVSAYLPLWFGPNPEGDPFVGALVEVRTGHDADRARRWFRATRAVVRDMVERDALAEAEAVDYLDARVTEWAGDRREVIPPS